jgi:hypothetical protein
MPKIHLTERSISKLPAPASGGRQTLHWDTALSGFAVLCSGSSSLKSYVVQRDVGGKSRRVHIGSVAELPLIKARDRAREALDDLRQGIMPAVKADKNLSLRAAIEGLVQRPDLRPASVRAYRMPLRTLSSWADLPLRSISGDMIERRHRELGAAIGGHTANATMRALAQPVRPERSAFRIHATEVLASLVVLIIASALIALTWIIASRAIDSETGTLTLARLLRFAPLRSASSRRRRRQPRHRQRRAVAHLVHRDWRHDVLLPRHGIQQQRWDAGLPTNLPGFWTSALKKLRDSNYTRTVDVRYQL